MLIYRYAHIIYIKICILTYTTHLHVYIHIRIFIHTQNAHTQMFIAALFRVAQNWKQLHVHQQTGERWADLHITTILPLKKKKQTTDTHKINFKNHYTEQKQPDIKDHTLYGSTYMTWEWVNLNYDERNQTRGGRD